MNVYLRRDDAPDEYIELTHLHSIEDVELFLIGYCFDIMQCHPQEKDYLLPCLTNLDNKPEYVFKFTVYLKDTILNQKQLAIIFNEDKTFNRFCYL